MGSVLLWWVTYYLYHSIGISLRGWLAMVNAGRGLSVAIAILRVRRVFSFFSISKSKHEFTSEAHLEAPSRSLSSSGNDGRSRVRMGSRSGITYCGHSVSRYWNIVEEAYLRG